MNVRLRKALRSLALFALVAGCAPIPAFTFAPEIDSGTSSLPPDATVPGSDAGGTEEAGGGAGGDSSPMDYAGDDAGDSASTVKCGSTLVANCAACAGSPLRCKKGTRDECVAECSACAPGWFPCLHCPNPTAAPRGQCLPVGANGQVACARGNLCPCTVETDCPAMSGSAQTCDLEGARKGCLPCGAPTTAGAACVSASGVVGVCQIEAGAAPRCD